MLTSLASSTSVPCPFASGTATLRPDLQPQCSSPVFLHQRYIDTTEQELGEGTPRVQRTPRSVKLRR